MVGPNEVQWLSPDENDAWMSLCWLMTKLPGAIDAQLQRDSGITFFEYVVLASLSMSPGRRMTMTALAEFANGSLSRLSNVAKRLEQRGLLVREPAPENGRITEAMLTEAGMAVVEQAAPGHVENVRRCVFDALGADQVTQLRDIGRQVAAQVEPGRSWPPGAERATL
ncbi:MarR family winged helix-turn-helix transcriptional regulator [Promicromonospora sp. NPDC050880]|uniref:MarR family winged helix-turn-helix transcriptional regulator n=1 Tax=Promicromonospora sp. NPDC050880 TaxID=3364406 RepID=UPI00379D3313